MDNNNTFQILFNDEYIAVIYKPSGLLSVPYPGSKGQSALDLLEKTIRKQGLWNKGHRPFAVHRLDRDTSGILMFALSYQAQQKIMNSWHQMVTERLYRAVAENPKNPKTALPEKGVIDAPLTKNAYNQSYVPEKIKNTPQKNQGRPDTHHHHKKTHKQIQSFDTNKKASFPKQQTNLKHVQNLKINQARTNYKIIKRGKKYTLFELELDTGKKNQIRAHLAYLGYPLAGDKNYRAKTDPFKRLALHARTLEFIHPYTKQKMHFEVKEPTNWESITK